jgi:CobW/HypB/UreG, nucleotide-binding domain
VSESRVPIEILTGRNATTRAARLAVLIEARRPGQHLAVLTCSTPIPADAAVPEHPGVTIRRSAAGCPCCVGQVAFRVSLIRLLREVRPDRLLIELPADEHFERTLKRLGDEWMASAVEVKAVIDADQMPSSHS